jgi:hypothetical protein
MNLKGMQRRATTFFKPLGFTDAMRFRKLRIAWSVAWGVVAVLLCMFWVQSYWTSARVGYADPKGYRTTVGSNRGYLYLIHHFWSPGPVDYRWGYSSGKSRESSLPFGWTSAAGVTRVLIPYSCIMPAIVTAALLPWLRFRFSLRTLLIVTALVAVVLGITVWMLRAG